MTLKIITTNVFEKELKKAKKRGKNLKKFAEVIEFLVQGEQLPPKNREHKLSGNYKGHWECHIEPDWLLVYTRTKTELVLIRTGSHADLF